jgi:hypothetical protein
MEGCPGEWWMEANPPVRRRGMRDPAPGTVGGPAYLEPACA